MKKTTLHRRSLRRLGIGTAAALAACAIVGTSIAPANAVTQDAPSYSGAVRSYGAYAAADIIFGYVSARANVSESVAVADSNGLAAYAGTKAGDYGIPQSVAKDPNARSFARSAPVGAGIFGLPITPIQASSTSGVLSEGGLRESPAGTIKLGALGNLNLLSSKADTSWGSSQQYGGVLAEAEQTTGTLTVLPKLALPGFSAVLPLVGADIGQTSGKVELVSNGTNFTMKSSSQWTFLDGQILGNLLRVSWSGSRDTAPTMIATANGLPNGAKVDQATLPAMTLTAATVPISIKPNASIDLNAILPRSISKIVSGSIAYAGPTNVYEAADGTEAHASMNGLNASVRLLKVLPFLPALGSAEFGFMRSDVSAKMQKGGYTVAQANALAATAPVAK